jgi:SAM-dependent methyltransferase
VSSGPGPDDESILAELVALARRPDRELLQFGSLAGAYQYRRLYRMFRRHVPAGAEVLDWGAGNGHFSYFLTRAGYRTTGFSLDPCGFAGWLGATEYGFVRGRLEEPVALPWPAETFDAVASVGVLEHVRETGGDEAQSLAEIARVLKPGGVFVAYHFPNQTSWIDLAARGLPGKHHHRFRYTPADVEALARGAGLERIETARYGLLPRNGIHRLLGPLRGSRAAARAYDALDGVLGIALGAIAQNHAFVARRPRRAPPTVDTGGSAAETGGAP